MLMRAIEDTTVCPGMLMRIPQYVLVRYESDRGCPSMLMRVIEDITVCPGMLMRVIEDTSSVPAF